MTGPAPEYEYRCRRALALVGAPSFVVTDLSNVRYLTGFTGSNGAVVVSKEGPVLVTDGRYTEQAGQECPGLPVVLGRNAVRAAVALALEQTGSSVAYESEHVTVADLARLRTAFPGADLLPEPDVVAQLRRCKDDGERALIARACAIIGEAIELVVAQVRPGMSERWIARRLHDAVVELGAEDVAFPSIIAGGPHSAIPHHTPTDRELQPGDLLKVDAGALVSGYRSDLTRVFVVGAEPTDRQLELHQVVDAAAASARQAVAPGVPIEQVVAACTLVLADAGWAKHFTHGLGHGVGLAIHEAPLVAAGVAGTIEAGDVLTIEPGVYFPGFGGVRIEDTLAVTGAPDGTNQPVECLTTVTRELRRVG